MFIIVILKRGYVIKIKWEEVKNLIENKKKDFPYLVLDYRALGLQVTSTK